MCEEELVGKKLQCAEFQEALFDLRLEVSCSHLSTAATRLCDQLS